MKRIDTETGEYLVYHVTEAGSPGAYDTTGGEWFFQPADDDSGDVYSNGYASENEAEQAALSWATEQADEWGPDNATEALERGPR